MIHQPKKNTIPVHRILSLILKHSTYELIVSPLRIMQVDCDIGRCGKLREVNGRRVSVYNVGNRAFSIKDKGVFTKHNIFRTYGLDNSHTKLYMCHLQQKNLATITCFLSALPAILNPEAITPVMEDAVKNPELCFYHLGLGESCNIISMLDKDASISQHKMGLAIYKFTCLTLSNRVDTQRLEISLLFRYDEVRETMLKRVRIDKFPEFDSVEESELFNLDRELDQSQAEQLVKLSFHAEERLLRLALPELQQMYQGIPLDAMEIATYVPSDSEYLAQIDSEGCHASDKLSFHLHYHNYKGVIKLLRNPQTYKDSGPVILNDILPCADLIRHVEDERDLIHAIHTGFMVALRISKLTLKELFEYLADRHFRANVIEPFYDLAYFTDLDPGYQIVLCQHMGDHENALRILLENRNLYKIFNQLPPPYLMFVCAWITSRHANADSELELTAQLPADSEPEVKRKLWEAFKLALRTKDINMESCLRYISHSPFYNEVFIKHCNFTELTGIDQEYLIMLRQHAEQTTTQIAPSIPSPQFDRQPSSRLPAATPPRRNIIGSTRSFHSIARSLNSARFNFGERRDNPVSLNSDPQLDPENEKPIDF